ncbi:MAG: hypothetical protein ACM3NV_07205 [Syntrophothermus sp.]
MRKKVLVATALAALIAASAAGSAVAGNKEKVQLEDVVFEAGGGFAPSRMPKRRLAPIALTAEGKIGTTDGTHPPALTKLVLETDRNGAIDVKGYPTCRPGKLQAQDTRHAKAACKSALIGTGTTDVSIAFPESKDVPAHSELLVFNGGAHGGVTTLYIHAYITVPVPAAIVTTVKIKKVHHGRYGLQATATIPKIASGNGSVTAFRLKIDKKFTYRGRKQSVLSAKCPDGRLQAHATAYFSNGLKAATEFVRPCTGTG